MSHRTASDRNADVAAGNRRLLMRYEREVASCAAKLRHAERRARRGDIERLRTRLALFEAECAAIAEHLGA
jgi:hypothetical protein